MAASYFLSAARSTSESNAAYMSRLDLNGPRLTSLVPTVGNRPACGAEVAPRTPSTRPRERTPGRTRICTKLAGHGIVHVDLGVRRQRDECARDRRGAERAPRLLHERQRRVGRPQSCGRGHYQQATHRCGCQNAGEGLPLYSNCRACCYVTRRGDLSIVHPARGQAAGQKSGSNLCHQMIGAQPA